MVREAWKATYSPWDCKESDTTEQLTLSLWASLVAQTVKNLSVMQETQVQSLAWEDPLEKRNGYPLQHSFLENSVDRGVWGTTVHGVAKSQTQLRD